MFCPQCGSSNDEEYAFCKKCGASLRRGETVAPTVEPPATLPVSVAATPAGGADPFAVAPPAPPVAAPPPGGYAQAAVGQATEYAGFGWRWLAVFLDGILVGVISGMLGLMIAVVVGLGGTAAGADEDAIGALVMLFYYPIAIGLAWLYEALMVSSSKQGTLGKMAVGIVVTDMQGRRISFLRATGRHFGKIISSMILMAGYLMQPFTEKRQALHDMMAGCLVLRKVPR
jgi:uncharacterized RDD family membrane protein YckC